VDREFRDEWIEFLNELRSLTPGVQLLFAFLVTAPFTDRFSHMPHHVRVVYFVCFITTTAACAFLIAPSVYHRLHWRRDVMDKEQMFQTCNRLAIYGGVLLATSMTGAVFVLTNLIFEAWIAIVATAGAGLLFGWLWFGLPLSRRGRERRETTRGA
jgi:hypothetical protein